MDLPKATTELLRDEAYVFLCRHALAAKLETVEQETLSLLSSRPPFGMLARRQTREAFATSLRNAEGADTALRERIERFDRLETWLRQRLRRDLAGYLEQASADYRRLSHIHRLVGDWEQGLNQLPDLLTGFARELRALRTAAEAVKPGEDQPCAKELAVVRGVAVQLESQQARIDRTGAEMAKHAVELGVNEIRVPTLPTFRRTAWVDWLSTLPVAQAIAEMTRVEYEVRAFLTSGLMPIRSKLQAARTWCLNTQNNFLNTYWEQLRAHAQAYYVGNCDADEVLETLTERYDGEILDHQRAVTLDPVLARA